MEEPTNQATLPETQVEGPIETGSTAQVDGGTKTETGKEGQTGTVPESKWGTFKTPDEIYTGYKSLQGEYTKNQQILKQMQEKTEILDNLLVDDRFNEWVGSLNKPAEPEDLSSLSEEERIARLVERGISEKIRPLEQKVNLQDAQSQIAEAIKQYPDFDNHIEEITKLSKNPKYRGLSATDLYKQAVYDVKIKEAYEKGKQEALKSFEQKKGASTELPISTGAGTTPSGKPKDFMDAWKKAKEELNK